jgi:two-component system, NarL family, nitrate/nitrite response regulator NarL
LIRKIKVLVAEDHHIVREGLINCLNLNENVVVVGEACNGVEALNKAKELCPDMILLDISMPELDGMEVLQIIKKRNPEIKVLILTAHYETEYIEEVRSKGADGYLLKNTTLTELNNAINKINRGGKYFFDKQSEYSSDNLSDDPELTDREIQVLRMLVSELSTKVIAEKLNVSIRTVDSHRENIKKKLNANSLISLVKAAIKYGYVDVK